MEYRFKTHWINGANIYVTPFKVNNENKFYNVLGIYKNKFVKTTCPILIIEAIIILVAKAVKELSACPFCGRRYADEKMDH